MEIKTIYSADLEVYGDALVDMYIDTFSNGESFQYHNREDTKNYLLSLLKLGYGIIAVDNEQLLGAIFLSPLSFDNLVPDDIHENFDTSHSIYVSEMMVKKSHQGRGIGKQLLHHFLHTVDKNRFHDAFIRVWVENTSAIRLYEKVGFKMCSTIEQQVLLADKSKIANFRKYYLHLALK